MARRWLEYVRLDELVRAPRNPKRHDDRGITASMKRFGYVEPIAVDERTGRIVSGHGRLDNLEALHRAGAPPPDGIDVDPDDGMWLVPLNRGWSSANDVEADAYLMTANLLVSAGGWDDAELAAMAVEVGQSPLGLPPGMSDEDLNSLLADLERGTMSRDDAAEVKGDERLAGVDLIYTAAALSSAPSLVSPVVLGHCCLAVRSGWFYGVRSGERDRACRGCETWGLHKPVFVDNDYEHYDHARHREVVARWEPKYATVRDVMSPEQCDKAGIEHYPLGQVLEWAEDLLTAGAQNIVVIPKIDVLDQIPDHHVLGYSVPSSYGGTPLPIEAFKGRRVHLLGGSPNTQLSYWRQLPDDVVSLDNNSLLRVAQWGSVWRKDGLSGTLSDYGVEQGDVSNPMYVALALSFGHVAQWFRRGTAAQTDESPEEATIRE